MLVKASAITNLTDARYFAAREVDFLGFQLDAGAADYLDPIYMKAIREWVEGPKIVGEFDRSPAATAAEAADFFGLDAVQVSQTEGLELLAGRAVILAISAPADPAALEAILRKTAGAVSYFLLEFTGLPAGQLIRQAVNWKPLLADFPTLLDFQFSAPELPGLLDALQPAGLALRGGSEERVGVKSFEELDEILDLLDAR